MENYHIPLNLEMYWNSEINLNSAKICHVPGVKLHNFFDKFTRKIASQKNVISNMPLISKNLLKNIEYLLKFQSYILLRIQYKKISGTF